ncbi:MAG: hypothetical protein LC632_09280 [Xanthomonadaceae bacterium]|nr:hypothetical protein [Xanthomonadaceae bacterium]
MKKSKLFAALAAGMLISVGAHAQDAAPATNLGPAVVTAAQGGLFGNDGEISGAAALGIAVVTFAALSAAVVDDPAPLSPPEFHDPEGHASPAHVAP